MNRAKLLKKITSGKHDDGSSGWQGATMLLAIPVLAILARLFWYIEFKTRDSVRRKSVAALFDKLYFQDIVCLVWFLIDAFTHLSIELGYVVLALTNTAEKSDSVLGWIWREYARWVDVIYSLIYTYRIRIRTTNNTYNIHLYIHTLTNTY